MLQDLREKAQGWIAWVIIGMICITFVLFGTSNFFTPTSRQDTVVAKVDGTKITALELDNTYQRFLQQPSNESARLLDPTFVKKELLASLIDETTLLQGAYKFGMRVSPGRIQSTIQSIPFLNQDGHFSQEAYAHFLANSHYTDQEFKSLLQDSLLKQQLQMGLMQTAFALTMERENLVKFLMQKRDFRYLTVAHEPLEKEVTLTTEEINQYYNDHLKKFMTDEQVALEYVHLSLNDLMAKYQPSEHELQQFYQENQALFNDPERVHVAHILIAIPQNADQEAVSIAKERIAEIQSKLKAGTAFEQLAREYSDDKASATSGGELEWFSPGEMVPKFEKVAFNLKNKGEISEPVRTQFGFHLIKLLEKKEEKIRSFAEAKSEAEEKLKQQWAQEQLANKSDEMSQLAFDHPDSLAPIVDKLGLTLQKTDLFTRQQGPKDTLLQQPTVLAAAFSQQVKEDKNNSDVLKLDEDNYIVLRVEKFIPSKQESLEEVKQQIKVALLEEKSEALAKAKAEEIFKTLLESKDTSALTAQTQWQEKKNVSRSAQELGTDLLEAVFSMSKVGDGKAPVLKVAELENGDYAVIWLTKVEDGSDAMLSAEEKENYQEALARNMGQLEYALFANALFQQAKVEKYLDKV